MGQAVLVFSMSSIHFQEKFERKAPKLVPKNIIEGTCTNCCITRNDSVLLAEKLDILALQLGGLSYETEELCDLTTKWLDCTNLCIEDSDNDTLAKFETYFFKIGSDYKKYIGMNPQIGSTDKNSMFESQTAETNHSLFTSNADSSPLDMFLLPNNIKDKGHILNSMLLMSSGIISGIIVGYHIKKYFSNRKAKLVYKKSAGISKNRKITSDEML